MVSIIIPTVDRHESLVKLVESIDWQRFDRQQLEILIVYNRSPKKRHRELYRSTLPGLRVLHAPFPGVNHARNTGLLAATGEILLFIDDDCLMDDPEFLQKMVSRHQEHPEWLAIGGPYTLSKRSSFWDRAYHANMTLWMEKQRLSPQTSRALLGGNASYKARAFECGRRFTPGIRYGGSETPLNEDLFEFWGAHGFCDDLALTHQSRLGFRDFIYKAYMQGRGYAEQTKRTPQSINSGVDIKTVASPLIRWALVFYSFVFMTGFRSSIHERRFFWKSVGEEFFTRLLAPARQWLKLIQSSLKVLRSNDVLRSNEVLRSNSDLN